MGTEQQQTQGQGSGQQTQDQDGPRMTEKPEVTEEHKEKAKEMAKAYEEDRPTSTLPGSDGTVSGTAVTEWVDEEDKGKSETSAEEGKVEYRNTEEFRKTMEE
jgi:flagellar biosynthesis/type III secretory pathway M-ring protein FliF/YscJ